MTTETMPYQNPNLPIQERVRDLLGRMTLEEKIGQMCQLDGRGEPERWLREAQVGSFLHVMGNVTQKLQKLAAQSRLGIPLIFGIDAIHGHAFWPTATVFPTQLALSCTWNPELVEQIGHVTAREVAATGVHWTFSPVLGIARDLRWGRVDETFGEDPYLIGVLGSALVRGYQGDDLSAPHTILACAKHYAGYSETRGGRDASEADHSRRKMRSLFLRPFHAAIEAGCATLMTAYQSIDGLPCSANRWLLDEVPRGEWGFEGFIVTDWDNVGRMHREQKVCATMEEAVQRAVESGNDMIMSTPDFPRLALALVRSGRLDVAHVDAAVRRILRLKFRLGLFDQNRYTDLEAGRAVIGCAAHRQVALESAYQSIVLLKNRDGILPLRDDLTRIAVIGPNADDPRAQLGDWVLGCWTQYAQEHPREEIVTLLDGIRARAGSGCRVDYRQGCERTGPATEQIAEAVEAARQAQVAIVVVGDDTTMNGECRDRADLSLSGAQQQLLEAVHATGTPLVVVLVNGKPLAIPWVVEHAAAILEAWNPGMAGGAAVAGILFGDRNPSGKLTISFPRHVGQQPVYYNQVPGWHADRYVDVEREPLFSFGYGLSYTSFAYSNLQLAARELAAGEPLRVTVDVENSGERAGTEIVQLYVNDLYSTVTTPVQELVDFRRVELQPGEKKSVRFQVPYERLALVNQELETVVEPGEFEVMAGGSARRSDLLKERFQVIGE